MHILLDEKKFITIVTTMSVVDITIVCIFLGATLHIGLRAGKNIKTFRDYAIGNRKFSDFVIFCTVAATCIGGSSTMGCVGAAYRVGVVQLVAQVATPLSFLVIAFILAKQFVNYYGCCSLGDIFSRAYGTPGKVMVGIIGTIYEVVGLGIQFVAMGTVLTVLTGLPYIINLFIVSFVLLIYTGRGGVKAVTFTDVLQFITLIIAIPLVLIIALSKIGGINQLFAILPESHSTFSGDQLRRYMFLSIPLLLPTLSAIHVQRLLMTRNKDQGMKAYGNLCWIYFFIVVMTVLLGLCARVLFPELPNPDHAFIMIIKTYLPVGIYGIGVIGILSVLMSTSDSMLNSSSIMFVNDVILPFKKDTSEAHKLKLAHRTAIMLGAFAVLFASQKIGLFESKILQRTLWVPICVCPLYLALFNRKISFHGFCISSLVGMLASFIWIIKVKPILGIDGIFPGLFANLCVSLGFYFAEGRPRVFTPEELTALRQKTGIPNKKKFTEESYKAQTNIWLGVCLICIQMVPLLFGTSVVTSTKVALIMLNGTMAVVLIFGSTLEIFQKHKQVFAYFRQITLFLCLPLTSLYLLFSSEENGLHLVALGVSFFIMTLIVEDKHRERVLFFCIALFAATLGFAIESKIAIVWPSIFCWWHIFYILGFLAVILLLRSSMRTLALEKEKAALRERYALARSISHDITTPMMVMRMLLKKTSNGVSEKERALMLDTLKEMGTIVDSIVPDTRKQYKNLNLVNLNAIIKKCISTVCFLHKDLVIHFNATGEISARVDSALLRRILTNILNAGYQLSPKNEKGMTIELLEDTYSNVQIDVIPSSNIPFGHLQKLVAGSERLVDKAGIGLDINDLHAIIRGWHGRLLLKDSEEVKYLFRIVLPSENNTESNGYENFEDDI